MVQGIRFGVRMQGLGSRNARLRLRLQGLGFRV